MLTRIYFSFIIVYLSFISVLGKDPPTQDVARRCAEKSEEVHYFINDFSECSGYHLCLSGVYSDSMKCDHSMHFDEKRQRCDYTYNVQCEVCDTIKMPNDVYRKAIQGTCTDFLLCNRMEGVRQTCPPGLVFKTGPFCEPETEPKCISCPEIIYEHVQINIPDPSSCTSYFVCSKDNKSKKEDCPKDEIFDIISSKCGKLENGAECILAPAITDCRANTIHQVPAISDAEPDCNKFHQCFRGIKGEVETCPTGFYFDRANSFSCVPNTDPLPDFCLPPKTN